MPKNFEANAWNIHLLINLEEYRSDYRIEFPEGHLVSTLDNLHLV